MCAEVVRRQRLADNWLSPESLVEAFRHLVVEADILAQIGPASHNTLDELRAWLREAHGVSASMGLMWNTLARLGLTLKKRRFTPPNRRVPTSLKRAAWC